MTDVGTSRRAPRKGEPKGNPVSRFFGFVALFVRQILDELRKVVWPTRAELWQYTLVVIVFVALIMALVAAMDYGFGKLVTLVFGN